MRQIEVGYLARHAPILDAMRHAERHARQQGRDAQGDIAMTAIQAHYAQYLVRSTRGLPMSTLAEHSRTSAANITQVVARMERHGLVRREPSDMDGRSIIVRITARGIHEFWRLLTIVREIEAKYRADALATPGRALHAVLRRFGPPLPRLAPDPPFKLRRYRSAIRAPA